MEPFALFNLLKSLLASGDFSPSASSANANTTSQPTEEKNAEITPQPKTENGTLFVENAPSQNYCLDFIRRHEERAGRRK